MRQVWAVGVVCVAVSCGEKVECGSGTTLVDGACVADDGPVCGDGTTEVDGACVPDSALTCGPGTEAVSGECVPTDPLECGDGTFPHDGECVPYDPSDATKPVVTAEPTGGRVRLLPAYLTLETDEPATIYWFRGEPQGSDTWSEGTSPTYVPGLEGGVAVHFYAIDPAGNRSDDGSVTFDADGTPPSAVGELGAAEDTGVVTVTWANPTDDDLAGVLLARSTTGLSAAPEPGHLYQVGDHLADGAEVVLAGPGASYEDSADPGDARLYAAWAFDDLGNYSPIATAGWTPDGGVSIDPGSGIVDAGTHDDVKITGTAHYDADSAALTVELSIQNLTPDVMFNPKVMFGSVAGGTLSEPDGEIDDVAYRYYGPEALAPGDTRTRTIVFTDVEPDAPVALDVTLRTDPMLFGGHRWEEPGNDMPMFDIGAQRIVGYLDSPFWHLGPKGDAARPMQGALSPDARYLYMTAMNNPEIAIVDLTTRQAIGRVVVRHANAKASLGELLRNPVDGLYYGLLLDGGHWPIWPSRNYADAVLPQTLEQPDIYLVRFDLDLKETGRVKLATLVYPNPQYGGVRPRRMAFSPDGAKVAIPVTRYEPAQPTRPAAVHLVDLSTLTEIDTDANTTGVQPVDVTSVGSPSATGFSADGTKVYASTDYDNLPTHTGFTEIDLGSGYAVRRIDGANGVKAFALDDQGRVWLAGRFPGLRTLSPGSDTLSPVASTEKDYIALATSPDGSLIYAQYSGTYPDPGQYRRYDVIDAATGAMIATMSGPDGEYYYGNRIVVTPF